MAALTNANWTPISLHIAHTEVPEQSDETRVLNPPTLQLTASLAGGAGRFHGQSGPAPTWMQSPPPELGSGRNSWAYPKQAAATGSSIADGIQCFT